MTLLGLLVGSEEEGEAQLLLLLLSICPSGFQHSRRGLNFSYSTGFTSLSLRPSVWIGFKHPLASTLGRGTGHLNFSAQVSRLYSSIQIICYFKPSLSTLLRAPKPKKNSLWRFECMYFSFTLDRRYWIHLVQQFNHPNYLLR